MAIYFPSQNSVLWQRPLKDGGTCCSHIRSQPTVTIQMYGSSNGSDSLCRTSSLSSHFLSPLHPCPAWSGPPYIWQRPFLYALPLSFSLSLLSLLTVRFKPKNPHSGLNPKAIGHKRGPLLPHTLTCVVAPSFFIFWYFLFIFAFFLFSFVHGDLGEHATLGVVVRFQLGRGCWVCLMFSFSGFFSSLLWLAGVCEHVELNGSLWRGWGVCLIFGKLGFLWTWSALASGRGTWGSAIMIIIIIMGLGKLRREALS